MKPSIPRAAAAGLAAALLAAQPGCGDDSKACGPGTVDEGGFCLPAASCGPGTRALEDGACVPDGTVLCTDGTAFDPGTGRCVIDPSACQGGTVLVRGRCQDPAAGLAIDLEEGPEPNGLAPGDVPAGDLALPAIDVPGVVVHGCITPFEDRDGDGQRDADLDAFRLAVAGPTLVEVTADGVEGLAAGFVALSDAPALAGWARIGASLAGDASRRQLFLPAAGTYALAFADVRSLALGGAAAGSARSCYYATLTRRALPTPNALVAGPGATGALDGAPAFYRAPTGLGTYDVALAMPQAQARASLVVLEDDALRAIADEPASGPAEAVVTGVAPAAAVTLVVDDVHAYGLDPVAYALALR